MDSEVFSFHVTRYPCDEQYRGPQITPGPMPFVTVTRECEGNMHSLVSSVRARHEIPFSFTLIFKLKVPLTISLLRQFTSRYEQRIYLMSVPRQAMTLHIPNARDTQSNSREAAPPRVSYLISIFIDANDSSKLFGGNGNQTSHA